VLVPAVIDTITESRDVEIGAVGIVRCIGINKCIGKVYNRHSTVCTDSGSLEGKKKDDTGDLHDGESMHLKSSNKLLQEIVLFVV
jgi:hypothetical protein